MLSGRNRAHVQRIQTGCKEHPEYRGKGDPAPHCHKCFHIHKGWAELVATMRVLVEEASAPDT